MPYKIELTPQADKDFLSLDKSVAQHIANRLDWLSRNAESIIHIPLKGPFKGAFKLRAGDWRTVYSVDREMQLITVYAVRHRSEVYKI